MSIEIVFSEGKFVEVDNWIVWIEGVDCSNGNFDSLFILEWLFEGGYWIIVVEKGVLCCVDGMIVEI